MVRKIQYVHIAICHYFKRFEAIAVIGGIGINENTSVMALVNAAVLAIMLGFW